MKRILIVDASKASLVMTSEVFKDHFPGIQVFVARSSVEAMSMAKVHRDLDAFVVDFDLPDVNGAQTAARLKLEYANTPVLMTAFDFPHVRDLIEKELSAYDDCLSWVKKPIRADALAQVAKRFCEGRIRTQRRVVCNIPAHVELQLLVLKTAAELKAEKVTVAASAIKSKSIKKPSAVKNKSGTLSKAKTNNAKSPVAELSQFKKVTALMECWLQDCSTDGIKIYIPRSSLKSVKAKQIDGFGKKQLQPGFVAKLQIPSFSMLQREFNVQLEKLGRDILTDVKLTWSGKPAQPIKSKVVWSREESHGWTFGVHGDAAQATQKLFELLCMVDNKARGQERDESNEARQGYILPSLSTFTGHMRSSSASGAARRR